MSIIYNLFIGLLASFIGVLPPGLINMYAAKVSRGEGTKKAMLFTLGVCVTVMAQTVIALFLARYIEMHPEIVNLLQKVALGIFICLTIYFFFIAKDSRREIPENEAHSKTNRFFSGMLVAALNLLPLPYWVYISLTFSGFGWFSFGEPAIWFAILGSGIGTLSALALYVRFFRPKDDSQSLTMNMNFVIGVITAIISVITFLKIIKEI